MNLKTYLLFLFLLSSVLSRASSSSPANCNDYAALSTHAMLQCEDKALQRYDRQLNIAYQKLMRTLPLEERIRLKKAEQAWMVYRDLECHFEGFEMRDGSGEALLIQGCLIAKTRSRLKELRQMLPVRR